MRNLLSLKKYLKRIPLVIIIPTLFLLDVSAYPKKKIKYPVSEIPEKLLKEAKAVIRKDDASLLIESKSSASYSRTYAITILNENGIENAEFESYYNEFFRVKLKDATIYDASGKTVKHMSKEDIIRTGTTGSGSSFDKTRVIYFDPEYRDVPFTIEYDYEITFKGLLNFPRWFPCNDFNVSVDEASLTVTAPDNYNIRYKGFNGIADPSVTNSDGYVKYLWSVNEIPVIKHEHLEPPSIKRFPLLLLAPSDFIIDNYQGNCETWEQFGKWFNKLCEGRQTLPVNTIDKIRYLCSGTDNEEEKARILYEYMQAKTRYISIQLGIGGWQPALAEEVNDNGYGDCKALANYMVSLLRVVGIEAHYSLVKAGTNADDIVPEFPSNQFNHVIVCMPNHGDTIWLECTDQTMPFGYLGGFTDDRYTLLVNENGGQLVKTIKYDANDNNQSRTADIRVDTVGNATANVKTSYKGQFYSNKSYLLQMDEKDRRKRIINSLNIPHFNMLEYSLEENKDIKPEVVTCIKLDLPSYCQIINNKLIVNLNLTERIRSLPYSFEERKSSIVVKRSLSYSDTINYVFPDNYTTANNVDSTYFCTNFGSYLSKTEGDGNKVTYIRKLLLKKGIYEPSQYNDLISFFEKINRADGQKLLVNKED